MLFKIFRFNVKLIFRLNIAINFDKCIIEIKFICFSFTTEIKLGKSDDDSKGFFLMF